MHMTLGTITYTRDYYFSVSFEKLTGKKPKEITYKGTFGFFTHFEVKYLLFKRWLCLMFFILVVHSSSLCATTRNILSSQYSINIGILLVVFT